MVEQVGALLPSADEMRQQFGLTVREVQVALLLAQRRTHREIASALGISEHTARHHSEQVREKLGEHSRSAVAERLIKW